MLVLLFGIVAQGLCTLALPVVARTNEYLLLALRALHGLSGVSGGVTTMWDRTEVLYLFWRSEDAPEMPLSRIPRARYMRPSDGVVLPSGRNMPPSRHVIPICRSCDVMCLPQAAICCPMHIMCHSLRCNVPPSRCIVPIDAIFP